jgi:uncharacterized protein (TIGR02145 family)
MHFKTIRSICLFGFIGVFTLLSFSCNKDDHKKNNPPVIHGVTDIDGNVYDTVTIGDQTWMVENLRTTHYNNGDIIDSTIPATKSIVGESEPEYQWIYNGDYNLQDFKYYGRLYTWYVVADPRNICPEGWHIPSDDEWKQLELYLGMSQSDADAYGTYTRGINEGSEIAGFMNLWSRGTIINGLNFGITGFQAIPAGYRYPDGTFYYIGLHGFWWTSTEFDVNGAWFRQLFFDDKTIFRDHYGKTVGFSVRCLKD